MSAVSRGEQTRLVFFDRASDTSGFAELSTGGDPDDATYAFGLWRGGHGRCYARGAAPAVAAGPDCFEAGPLRFETGDPGAWRVAFAASGARCDLECRLVDGAQPGHGGAFVYGMGTVAGRVVVEGEETPIAGVAESSAGAIPPLAEQDWAALVVEDVDHGCRAQIATVDGRDQLTGYLRHEGETAPLRWADLAVAYAYAGGPPLQATLSVRDTRDRRRTYSLDGRARVSRVEASAAVRRTFHTTFPALADDGGASVGYLAHSYERAELLRPRFIVRAQEDEYA